MSAPTRIDEELFARAQAVSAAQNRSAAQQINHWARLGAAVEAGRVSARELEDVLAGRRAYDEVDDYTQAAVRVAWDERLEHLRQGLDLADAFAAEGRDQWVVADDDGNAVEVTHTIAEE